MEPSPEAIVEAIIDPLMMSDLAHSYPAIILRRTAPDAVEIDFGEPETAYRIKVERVRSDPAG